MSARDGQSRALWLAAFVAVAVVVAVVFAALRLRSPSRPTPQVEVPKNGGTVRIVPVDRKTATQELALLSDPTPLFLPTAVNTSEVADIVPREPSAVFRPMPPKLAFAEFDMSGVVFPDPIAVPSAPVAALTTGSTPNPYITLGRVTHSFAPLPNRAAFLEVLDARTGRVVLSGALGLPAGADLPGLWDPLELVAAVDLMGLIGDLTVTSGSGQERVDTVIRRFIVEDYRLGERLRPGFYAIRVGP